VDSTSENKKEPGVVWLSYLLIPLVAALIGSASAGFLVTLDWVTQTRESHFYWILLLPLAGGIIGWVYYHYGSDVAGGNSLVIAQTNHPTRKIPIKMLPFVYLGTLLTHLAGGSAGREGTAVQMGASISDQLSPWSSVLGLDRRMLLMVGVSAGFASVFGTPLAGAVFALEVNRRGLITSQYLLPSLISALVADAVVHAWQVPHTHYAVTSEMAWSVGPWLWALVAGVFFGLASLAFVHLKTFFAGISGRWIAYPPLRPVLGGAVLMALVYFSGQTRYLGLGIPVIESAFLESVYPWDFALKILFTTFTLAVGFKGGEVTPLFFIGATLGNVLALFLPLPMDLLAGMGFVAVFAGATKTPLACILMGAELFGFEGVIFWALACTMAYAVSGKASVYQGQ
jgi:H+/Cl- antiporter ClcA